MTLRITALAGLLLTALTLSAFAQKDKDDKDKKDKDKDKKEAKVYKTPQEVFDAFVAANDKDDYKTMAALMAPEAQKDAAAVIAVLFGADRAELEDSKEKAAQDVLKTFKPVFDAMDRHGVTTKVLREVKKSKDKKEMEKSKKVVSAVIKDPEAFFADVLGAFDKLGLGGEKPKSTEKLTGLKVDGDKAEGTVVRTTVLKDKKEKVKKEPVKFVKINGSWRIIPSMDLDDDDGKEEKKDEKKDK
jgi:hypothetical protein